MLCLIDFIDSIGTGTFVLFLEKNLNFIGYLMDFV